MSPVLRRIVAALGAHSFGQAMYIAMQLASLPLFLHHWAVAQYGIWLMMSALPTYISMADVGMVAIAGNRMTMEMARGQYVEANATFQSAFAFMLIVCSTALLICVPTALLAPVKGLTTWDERLALAALLTGTVISMFGGLNEAVFKCTGRYATGVMSYNLIRLGEWTGQMTGLAIFGTFSGVALCGLSMRILGVMTAIWIGHREAKALEWGVRHARRDEVKGMFKPAISYMSFPVSNAIAIQGVTLLVGAMFGPVSVAIFNTYRTLSRIVVQFTGVFSLSLWVEFANKYAQGGARGVAKMYSHAKNLGVLIAVTCSACVYLAGPLILKLWTHGRIAFAPNLMCLLLVYATAAGIWHVPRVLLQSTNQHIQLAQWTLASALASIALAYVLGRWMQLNGVALGILIAEAGIAATCTRLAHRLARDSGESQIVAT